MNNNKTNNDGWQKRFNVVQGYYQAMTKSEKSEMLSILDREYKLKPNTMISKLSGRRKIMAVEIFVIEVELKKQGMNINH